VYTAFKVGRALKLLSALKQGYQTRGQRAVCDPLVHFMRSCHWCFHNYWLRTTTVLNNSAFKFHDVILCLKKLRRVFSPACAWVTRCCLLYCCYSAVRRGSGHRDSIPPAPWAAFAAKMLDHSQGVPLECNTLSWYLQDHFSMIRLWQRTAVWKWYVYSKSAITFYLA
jgi:hypothetical protein